MFLIFCIFRNLRKDSLPVFTREHLGKLILVLEKAHEK